MNLAPSMPAARAAGAGLSSMLTWHLLVAPAVPAQSVVVPASAAVTQPLPARPFFLFSGVASPPDCRTQILYDTSKVPSGGAIWNSLQFRTAAGDGRVNQGMTVINVTIAMSVSPKSPYLYNATFAANHGPNPVMVFSGPLSLPPAASPAAWPAPWQVPIPFTTPFVYAPSGPTLVVDVLQTAAINTSAWYVEAASFGTSFVVGNGPDQTTCLFSTGRYQRMTSIQGGFVGQPWNVVYHDVLPNAPGVAAIGVQGAGGSWAGVALPIALAPFGAPGCSWSVSMDFAAPVVADTAGLCTWPLILIPNDPSLVAKVFYDQALWFDGAANAFGIVTSSSRQWTIGGSGARAGTVVQATGSAASGSIGLFGPGTVPTLRFNP